MLKKIVTDPSTHLTTGSSFENLTNLSPRFIERVISKYDGTRLGRQELYGELFSDVVGALWSYDLIERTRVRTMPEDLVRIAVALDPSTTDNNRSAEAGIITAGLGRDGHCYIMYDDSIKAHVNVWSGIAVQR
jgi:phage terminase large subunit-like protein